jgi:hypothetical protein
VWRKVWEGLQDEKFTSAQHIFIDSTIVGAHQHAAGALKKRWPGGTGSGPFSGRMFDENPCWVYK